jgi:phosphatidylinositol alpha 1,6-mannosyltransferase
MDLFVFPSQTETVGNVVLEAFASGVPVVAMARGGTKFIADNRSCAVLADNHAQLIDAARVLVADRARCDAMRVAARKRALHRSWERIFDDVYQAYRVAMSPTAAPGVEPIVRLVENQESA